MYASFSAGMLTMSVGSAISLSSSLIPLLMQEADILTSFETGTWLGIGETPKLGDIKTPEIKDIKTPKLRDIKTPEKKTLGQVWVF